MSNNICFTDEDIETFKNLNLTKSDSLPEYMKYFNTCGDGNCGWHALLQGIVETYVEYFQMAKDNISNINNRWSSDNFKHLKKFIEKSNSGDYQFTKEEILRAAYNNYIKRNIEFPREMINKLREYLLNAKDIIHGQTQRFSKSINKWYNIWKADTSINNDKTGDKSDVILSDDFKKYVEKKEERVNKGIETHYFKTADDEIKLMTSSDERNQWQSDYRQRALNKLIKECNDERERIRGGITNDGLIPSQYWITERIIQKCTEIFNLSLFSYGTTYNSQAAKQMKYEDMIHDDINNNYKHIIFIKTSGGHFEYICVTKRDYHMRIFNNFKKILKIGDNVTLDIFSIAVDRSHILSSIPERRNRSNKLSIEDFHFDRNSISNEKYQQYLGTIDSTILTKNQKIIILDQSGLEYVPRVRSSRSSGQRSSGQRSSGQRSSGQRSSGQTENEGNNSQNRVRLARRIRNKKIQNAEKQLKTTEQYILHHVGESDFKKWCTEKKQLDEHFEFQIFNDVNKSYIENETKKSIFKPVITEMAEIQGEGSHPCPTEVGDSSTNIALEVKDASSGEKLQDFEIKFNNTSKPIKSGNNNIKLFIYLYLKGKLYLIFYCKDEVESEFTFDVEIKYRDKHTTKGHFDLSFKCEITVDIDTEKFTGKIIPSTTLNIDGKIIFLSKLIINNTNLYIYLDKNSEYQSLLSDIETMKQESDPVPEPDIVPVNKKEDPVNKEAYLVLDIDEKINSERNNCYGPFLYRKSDNSELSLKGKNNLENTFMKMIQSILKKSITNIKDVNIVQGKMIDGNFAFVFYIKTNIIFKLDKSKCNDTVTALLYDLHYNFFANNEFNKIDEILNSNEFGESETTKSTYFTSVEPISFLIYKFLIENNIEKKSNYIIKYGKKDVYADINYCIFNKSLYLHKDYKKLYYKELEINPKKSSNDSSDELKKIIMNKDVFDKFYEKCEETFRDLNNDLSSKKLKELEFIYKILFLMSNNTDLDVYYKIKIDIILNMYKSRFKDPISYDYNLITNANKLKNNIKKTYQRL
jgi:hypothetical protein